MSGTIGSPGTPIEIVFSFDRTGSMGAYIEKVGTKVSDIITRLLGDIPHLRIAIFAHGDYCDYSRYVTKHIDFTRDVDELCKFVYNVDGTMGGDWEECYELVLQEVRTKLSWQPGSQRALVMIGDSIPHNVDYYKRHGMYTAGSRVIDWKEETQKLHDETGVHVYAVQCGAEERANFFWEHLAEVTEGKRLELTDFGGIVELVMAICYKESGPDAYKAYEQEVREQEGATLRRDLDIILKLLQDLTLPSTSTSHNTFPTTLTRTDTGSSSIISPRRHRKRKRPVIESDDDDDDITSAPGPSTTKPYTSIFGVTNADSAFSSGMKKTRRSSDSPDAGSGLLFTKDTKSHKIFESSDNDDEDDYVPDSDKLSYDSDAEINSSDDAQSRFSEDSEGRTTMALVKDLDDEDDDDDDYFPDEAAKSAQEEANVRQDVNKMFTDHQNKTANVPPGNVFQSSVQAPTDAVNKNRGNTSATASSVTKKGVRATPKTVTKKRIKAPVTSKFKISSKSVISLDKFLELNEIPPLHRESKTSVKLALPDLYWSRWKFAMGGEADVHGVKGKWRPRRGGHRGLRNTSLFKEGQEQPALYEFAVRLSNSPLKHTVLLRSTGGFENMCWDTYMLRDLHVRQEIDKIISLGHKLYARRAILTLPCTTVVRGNKVKLQDSDEVRQLLFEVYDYPWKRRLLENDVRGSRLVKRSSVVISGN